MLEEADFVVNPGERVGIVGKNGAGKSTLFALLQARQLGGKRMSRAAWQAARKPRPIAATGSPRAACGRPAGAAARVPAEKPPPAKLSSFGSSAILPA